jgi:hypothetical protein
VPKLELERPGLSYFDFERIENSGKYYSTF